MMAGAIIRKNYALNLYRGDNMKNMDYRIVKQVFDAGECKAEVLLHVSTIDYAFKELMKIVRESKAELLEYDCTIGILNDMGFLVMYFHSRGGLV